VRNEKERKRNYCLTGVNEDIIEIKVDIATINERTTVILAILIAAIASMLAYLLSQAIIIPTI
jgi:hypothetical protein